MTGFTHYLALIHCALAYTLAELNISVSFCRLEASTIDLRVLASRFVSTVTTYILIIVVYKRLPPEEFFEIGPIR